LNQTENIKALVPVTSQLTWYTNYVTLHTIQGEDFGLNSCFIFKEPLINSG